MSGVSVVAYTAAWAECFAVVREELIRVFAPLAIAVEHIGSTSVAGLAAKPVIDLLLGAGSLGDIEAKIPALGECGYAYIAKYEQELPQRRYFVKSSTTQLRIHLHAVERDSRLWQQHLAFRDALRADAALRSRYQSLKLRLAHEFADDKAAYQSAKSPFIQAVLADIVGRENVG